MTKDSVWDSAAGVPRCPNDKEVAGLYRQFETPLPARAHCCAVAWEADRLARKSGAQVNRGLLRAACLLHDLRRGEGLEHPLLAAGALAERGWPQVGELVRRHHDLGEAPSPEAELLYLADKRIRGTECRSLEERFTASRQKCRSQEALENWSRRYQEARALEAKYVGAGGEEAEDCAGIILAAGRSSRMGEFKPLLELDGLTMIRRVVGMMARAGCAPIVVVTGRQASLLEDHLSGEPVTFVHNPDYAGTQQLDSLCLGLTALEGRRGRALVCPADIPLVSDQTARQVLGSHALFARPVFGQKAGHPAALSLSLTPYLLSYDGPEGLRGAMEYGEITPVSLPVKDAAVVMDNDTPEDFRRSAVWCRRNRKDGETR